MKIAKKSNQKNVILNKEYYTPQHVNSLLKQNRIFYFDKWMDDCYKEVTDIEFNALDFRIYTDTLKEIKVVLDKYGFYEVVAIDTNNYMLHVSL